MTCDSFGSHYAFDGVLLSKVTDWEDYMKATKYYYDNIIGPFKPFMLKALARVRDFDISMICTGHGPVIDDKIDQILNLYEEWSTVVNPNPHKTVVIPYVSAYGYTKSLAEKIADGIRASGEIDVRAYDMVEADPSKVLEELGFADGILLGSPTILGEALKPIWDLTTSIFAGTHGQKLASAFGSYGWSGEAVPHLLERLRQLNMKVEEGFKVRLKPDENNLQDAFDYGFNFGCMLQEKENPKRSRAAEHLSNVLFVEQSLILLLTFARSAAWDGSSLWKWRWRRLNSLTTQRISMSFLETERRDIPQRRLSGSGTAQERS